MSQTIRRALLSVSDKTGIVDFARALAARDIHLISSGGTARTLRDAGIAVTEVSEHTGAPEIMNGRVKTLHPKVHGGILARRGVDDATLVEQNIDPIDLVVVNLYPFSATVAKPDCSLEDAIENIDIGGPTMVRASAKNHKDVSIVVDPTDYQRILDALESGEINAALRRELAVKAFAHTAAYDDAIVNYLSALDEHDKKQDQPRIINRQWSLHTALRYGENPHQQANFYADLNAASGTIGAATLLQGKPLSYNNLADADAAWTAALEFLMPACVIVKHANPCGIAVAADIGSAYEKAFSTDPTSAFGGIVAFNAELDSETAAEILNNQFVEVIIAPQISAAAREILTSKPNVRVLQTGCAPESLNNWELKTLSGGVLVQSADQARIRREDLTTVTEKAPTEQQINDMIFAWPVVKMVKSNAIVFAKDGQTIAIGAGQMSRVDSVRIAIRKAADAGLEIEGCVMASDAFFPFADAMLAGAEAGAKAIIQPGGSMRDGEVVAAANAAGVAMVTTGRRHFRH
ncbi:MAG: bifunctional phosphoribosylaminoimidazolecarboxamide formyltransferase/IMP cyclohydrolase [Oceanococcus sp.]